MINRAAFPKIILFCAMFLIHSLVIGEIPTDTRKDALVSAGIDGTCKIDSVNIKRYDIFPGYSECGEHLDSVKKYNPNSIVMLYNSGTDNYTTPGVTQGNYYGAVEHNWLRNRCIELGYSPEILYLHFYEDTELSGWSIPGTYSTSVTDGDSVCRAPDYLPYYQGDGVGRIIVNYAHPVTRQLQIEYACMLFDSLENSMWKDLNGRNSHFDGIYLDNWMHNWGRRGYGSMGRIDAGGRVAETPGANLIYGTEEFADWYWEQMKIFATDLRDTLNAGASWTQDGRKKYLSLNIGQSWNSDYTDPDVAGGDYLVMEFLYSPIRNPNASIYGFEGISSKDSACAVNGVSVVYCSRQEIGDNGEYTWGDAVYNNLVSFYGINSGESYFFQRAGLGSPYAAQYNEHFDSLAWRGCMDYDLGNALEHYEIYQTGTDPRGQDYKVFSRNYQKGLTLMRPLNDWGENFDANTKITVDLPGAYRKLNIDGSLGSVVTSVQLQNGAGAILIPADMGDCTSPPTIPDVYSPGNGQEVDSRPTLCLSNSHPGACLVGLSYDFQIATDASMSNIVAQRSGVAEGDGITCYTPSIDLSAGTYYWHGRAYNGTTYSGWSSVRTFTVAGTGENVPPSVPALSSPNNGATISTVNPSLTVHNSYDSDGDAVVYHFQVAFSNTFSNIVSQKSDVTEGGGSTTAWTVPIDLENGDTYFWRVRAFDGADYSAWSNSRSFNIQTGQNGVPSVPVVFSPENGAIVNTFWPDLVVYNSVDPDGDFVRYQYQVAASTAFNTIIAEVSGYDQSASSTTSWQVPVQLQDQTTYWWRVRATDGELYSAFSEPSSFFVNTSLQNNPPSTPLANAPGDGETVQATSPVVTVNNSEDEDGDNLSYQFEIWDNQKINLISRSSLITEGYGSTTSWQIDKVLDRAHRYYWKCRAYDGNDYSQWMIWRDFIVASEASDNNPPNTPQAYLPQKGDTMSVSSNALLVFNTNDPDGDPLTYEFVVCRDYNMNQVVDHGTGVMPGPYLTTPYYVQTSLQSGQEYFWHARAFDGQAYSSWTETRNFVQYDIAVSAEEIPRPLYPVEGNAIATVRPQFRLNTDQTDVGVNFYFEVADNISFDMPIVSGPVPGENGVTKWTPSENLKSNSGYYWRARAEKSGWCDPVTFNVTADIHVSPNPYRPVKHGEDVVFKNIPDGADIKISTINGDIIREFTDSPGPEVRWDVTNDRGRKLASGVYLYYVITDDATVSGKLAVIR
ncbi:MAG: hypothetical protein GF310_07560 [candidate division Zixibacteria bacterium]|nr:hypothetical protein [candidate division Zixibacteria bacterium]